MDLFQVRLLMTYIVIIILDYAPHFMMHSYYSYSAPDESISSLLGMNITVLFTVDREPIVTITFDVCDNTCKHLTFNFIKS